MPNLVTRNGDLYVENRRVLKGWESATGLFWFALEESFRQDTVIGSRVYEDDPIWYGFVQGHADEFGYFSEAQLGTMCDRGLVWPIKPHDLPFAGRRR